MGRWSTSIAVAGFALMLAASLKGVYSEPWRPHYHFTPAKNWMNDPNGLVYYKGEYHLFYQYNPYGNTWGHMSWGHAVSRDLVHWQHLPVALEEEDGIMIFSGSAVVDQTNSSGLCRSPERGDPSCLIAIYTGHGKGVQTQNIAFSNDLGRTWTKYEKNPVIDLRMRDFRDPKVFWHAPTKKWVMVTVLAREKKVRLFSSPNLREWSVLSDFGPEGSSLGVWECPDLFDLPVEGAPGERRWVLIVSVNPGAVAGGSGGQYFVGQFDGRKFVNENSSEKVMWIDYGKDFYAVQSYSDIPRADGRRIWIGWLSNWQYARQEPTAVWRTAQSIPRSVQLRKFPSGIQLVQEPVGELNRLRGRKHVLRGATLLEANRFLASKRIRGQTMELTVEFEAGLAQEFGVKVHKGADTETVIGINPEMAHLFVDRTKSGEISFHEGFPGRHVAPLPRGPETKLRIFLDRSSVEVFSAEGTAVISNRVFPPEGSNNMELFARNDAARILSLEVWEIKSAWGNK